jgi:hypothetical protein
MDKKLDLKLFNAFPMLYGQKDKPLTESLMGFGFECENGWAEIIWALSEKIEQWNKEHPDTPVQAMQVKEKYGGLRFYVNHEPDEIRALIDKAEKKSYKTCEMTGKPGRLCIKGSWYKTLSSEKAKEFGYKPVSEA